MRPDLLDRIEEAVSAIRQRSDLSPHVVIILGTGLGRLTDRLEMEATISYEEIPHLSPVSVESHSGRLLLGTLAGRPVAVFQGRLHFYEGHSMEDLTFPVRIARGLGASALVISNAAGALNPFLEKGDLVLIADHVNLMGDNPLIGPNDERLGPRFPDLSEPYSEELMALAEAVALEQGVRLHRGVYVAVAGPNLETRAEYRFLRGIGGDLVGMSTVPEVLVAIHGGMRALGFSVVTDRCLPDALEPVVIEEVIKVAEAAEPKLTGLVEGVIGRM